MKIELYTDGGCRGNGTRENPLAAIGIVLLIEDNKPIYFYEKLGFNPNTNNIAEICAIIRGIDLIKENVNFKDENQKSDLTIYSDSAYTINGITNWINGWRANGWITSSKTPVKNVDLWKKLDWELQKLGDYFNINFIKVKGHSGNQWNEKCDELVNIAMNEI